MKADATDPYGDLNIYYIQGRVGTAAPLTGEGCIGNWEEDAFSFLFFSKPADREVAELLSDRPDLTLIDRYQMTYADWHGGSVTAFRAGRFNIVPPWEAAGKPDKDTIILDPGVVFGTGGHATTHTCLEAMELAFDRARIDTVLDLGTGTGLLALAAAKLGCRQALAVDFNLLAARTARANIRLNGFDDRILAVHGRAEELVDCPSDLVVANIHYDVMRQLIATDGFLAGKWFILSGLLRSEARRIADILKRYPVRIHRTWEQDGVWHTFFGKITGRK